MPISTPLKSGWVGKYAKEEGDEMTTGKQPYPPARTAWYAIGVFALVNALDNVDRGIISLLIEPIKRDLLLSDTEISLLLGLAFSSFYALVGLPMSRFADTGPRKIILSFGIAFWSLATAAGSLAQSFVGLFISRAGTGAGESLKGPNALSMIADFVPREKYPRAMSVYQLGISVGAGLSLIIGGTLVGMVGGKSFTLPFGIVMSDWQFIFMLVGLPGLLVALLITLTVPEPPRRGRETKKKQPVGEVIRFLKREKAIYVPFLIGISLLQIEAVGLISWRVPFFERTYGWGPEQIGPIAGTMGILLTPIGLFFGAMLGERLVKNGNAGAMVKLSMVGTVLSLPMTIASFLSPTPWISLAFLGGSYIAIGIGAPAAVAALQTVTPNEFRGQLTAIYLFTISVIGSAFGPLSVALFTDYIFKDEADLRYAMVAVAAIFGIAGLMLIYSCMKPYAARVRMVIEQEEADNIAP